LLGICAYLLLHTAASTFLYFEQGRIVAESLTDTVSRTRYFAAVDFSVSSLTLALQVFLTGRLMKRFGLVLCLAILPVVTVVAFGALALAPTLLVLALVQVARRALDYAIARPAREVLFTVVSREEKYKAKNAIETLVYRGGDAVSGWLSSALSAVGVGLGGIAVVAMPVAATWCALCVWLAKRQDRMRQRADAATTKESLTTSRPHDRTHWTMFCRHQPGTAPASHCGGSALRHPGPGALAATAGAQGGKMLTRKIPSTGELLPVVGCGTWQGFGHAPGSAEYARLPGVVEALFDAGGTVLDSSPMYGRSEKTTGSSW
jgi:hypothetical protein